MVATMMRGKVLLVEDVAVNRRVAAAFLAKQGHCVVEAVTGQDALDLVDQDLFDLILLDIRLPDMDGVDVAAQVRRHVDGARASIPILALTANVFPDDIKRYRDVGMNGVVAKPIQLAQFRLAVETVLKVRDSDPKSVSETLPKEPAEPTRPMGFSETGLLDQGFIAERLETLGRETFLSILKLGLRTTQAAAQDVVATGDQQGAANVLGKAAHRLAGASSNFGFAALFTFAQTVERLAETGTDPQVTQARTLAADGLTICHQTHAAVESWLAERGVEHL